MRWLFLLLVSAPAYAGVNVENVYVGLHKQAGTAIDARFRLHCLETVAGACPGGTGSYDTESPSLARAQWMDIRAAAAGSICTTGSVIGSPFDVSAGAHLGPWWTARTSASKAQMCVLVDEWW